jgi:hypothetical protein
LVLLVLRIRVAEHVRGVSTEMPHVRWGIRALSVPS